MKKYIYNLLPIFIQNWLISTEGYRRKKIRFNNDFSAQVIKECLLSEDEKAKLQYTRILDYLKYAKKNSSFWEGKISNEFINDFKLEKLRNLKISTKQDVLNHKKAFEGNYEGKSYLINTSGTSGAGLSFFTSKNCISTEFNLVWNECYFAHKLGDKYATFNGNTITPLKQNKPPFWRYNKAFNQTLFSIFHMNNSNLMSYYNELKNNSYLFINGYPSSISILADYILEFNLNPLKLEAIYTSSESLFDIQRSKIEKAFQCKVFDFYSNAEQTIFCFQQEDGVYKTSCLHSYVWFKKTNIEIEGEMAYKVIGTNFNNYSTFFINYDTNDLVLLDENKKIKKILGRQDDVIELEDGRKIGRLDHLFKNSEDIIMAQIVQQSFSKILLNIQLKNSNNFNSKKTILREIENRISNEIEVEFNIVKEIPKQPNGKFKFVVKNFK